MPCCLYLSQNSNALAYISRGAVWAGAAGVGRCGRAQPLQFTSTVRGRGGLGWGRGVGGGGESEGGAVGRVGRCGQGRRVDAGSWACIGFSNFLTSGQLGGGAGGGERIEA